MAFGCVALLGFSVCVCLALGVTSFGLLTYIAREPEGLSVEYALPTRVQRGDEFDLVLTLTNVGNTELLVSDINLDEALSGSILDGAIVIDTDPPMARDYSIPGIKSFSFGRAIPAGESRQVTFHLQAITIGDFAVPSHFRFNLEHQGRAIRLPTWAKTHAAIGSGPTPGGRGEGGETAVAHRSRYKHA